MASPLTLICRVYRTNLSIWGLIILFCLALRAAAETPGNEVPPLGGTIDRSFDIGSRLNSGVETVSVQPDGKIILGGTFTTVRGAVRYGIARLNSDGTVDPSFDPGTGIQEWFNDAFATHVTSALLLSSGKILLIVQGGNRNFLGRLNTNGSVDVTFDPGAGLDPYSGSGWASVYCLAEQADGKVLVGGHFRGVNGMDRRNIARFNDNGSVDLSFQPESSEFEWIFGMASSSDGKVLVIGEMIGNGPNTRFVRRLNSDGTIDDTFAPPSGVKITGSVVLFQPDGKIIVRGEAPSHGPGAYVFRLNGDGTLDRSFYWEELTADGVQLPGRDLALQPDGKILVGGFIRLNSDGRRDETFNSDAPLDRTGAIALQPDGKLIVTLPLDQRHVKRLNTDGSLDSSFEPHRGANGNIHSVLELPDGKILVAGNFTNINGIPRKHLARLNPDGSLDHAFDASSTLLNPPDVIAIDENGNVLVAGNFPGRVLRLDATGRPDTAFSSAANADLAVNAIAVRRDGKIILAGGISAADWLSRTNVVQLNHDGSADPSFVAPGLAETLISNVRTIALQSDGKLIIGGSTWRIGYPDPAIARLNEDGSLDKSFTPSLAWPPCEFCTWVVDSLAVLEDGKIIVHSPYGIVRLNPDGSQDSTFKAARLYKLSDRPVALQPDGKLIVATELDARTPIFRVVRLDIDGAIDPFFQPANFNGSIRSLFVQGDGRILVSGDFTIANDVATTVVTRLLGDSLSAPPVLRIQRAQSTIDLRWLGKEVTLESASSINGPFTALPQAISPYFATANKDQEFFRLTTPPVQPASN